MTVPPTPAARLHHAETEATGARERLSATLGELQVRLDPKTLARDAVNDVKTLARGTAADVKTAGGNARQVTVNTAIRNPGAVAGVSAALALFLLRRPLFALFRRAPEKGTTAPLPKDIHDDRPHF